MKLKESISYYLKGKNIHLHTHLSRISWVVGFVKDKPLTVSASIKLSSIIWNKQKLVFTYLPGSFCCKVALEDSVNIAKLNHIQSYDNT